MSMSNCPVIAIDGPTASGKGTVAALVAGRLGYHYLDSGAIYRVLAVAVAQTGLNPDLSEDLKQIIPMAANLPVQFQGQSILLQGNDVSEAIRTEEAGVMASRWPWCLKFVQACWRVNVIFDRIPVWWRMVATWGLLFFPTLY